MKSIGFHRILCPVDFSAHSRNALREASSLAQRSGGKVFVLFVSDPLLDAAAAAAGYNTATIKASTEVELRRFVARAGVIAAGQLLTVGGHAAPAIQRTADRIKADLIVMGSHGLTGPAKAVFGSTTERVLRQARVPVMVVPRRGRRRRGQSPQPPETRRMALIPIDLEDYAMADVRKALDVVKRMEATPMFIHVVPPVRLPAWLRLNHLKVDLTRFDAKWRAIKRAAGGRAADCRLVFGDPSDQIAATAAGAGIGLIVVPLKKTPSIFGPRRGAISYQLVAREVATVVAVPGVRSRA